MPKQKSSPNELATRLKSLLNKNEGRTQANLSRFCGVSTAAASKWFARGEITLENLTKAAEFFNVSLDWLAYGVGSKDDPRPPVRSYTPGESPPPEGYSAIPLSRLKLAAGAGDSDPDWVEINDVMPCWQPDALFQAHRTTARQCRMAEVSGDSMEPTLSDGDRAIWIMEPDPRLGCVHIADGKIYVLAVDGMPRIKRLRRIKGGLILVSDNSEAYPPETYLDEECDHIRVYGRVIQITREL